MASRTWLERADRRRHSNRVALSAVARSIAPDDSAKAALRVLPAIPMVCGPPAQRAYVFPMFFRAVRLLFRLLLKWFHVNVSRGRARTPCGQRGHARWAFDFPGSRAARTSRTSHVLLEFP